MSGAICHGDKIVGLAKRSFVLLAPRLRLLSNKRSESFPLRHDATGLHYDETPGHRGCNS
jgi:hypothetical protein